MLTAFSAVGVVLAGVGLYGVLSYIVAARRRELGVRLALGATSRDLLGLVVGQGAVVVAAGMAGGVAGALMLARVVESVLFGVTAREPSVYAVAALGVGVAAGIGIWLPARQAIRVDPVDVLRCE
jgi:ABC-type antimicrobial peptide transport system permease subunit